MTEVKLVRVKHFQTAQMTEDEIHSVVAFLQKEAPGITFDYFKSRIPIVKDIFIFTDKNNIVGICTLITDYFKNGSRKRFVIAPSFVFLPEYRNSGLMSWMIFLLYYFLRKRHGFVDIWVFSICSNYRSYLANDKALVDLIPLPNKSVAAEDYELLDNICYKFYGKTANKGTLPKAINSTNSGAEPIPDSVIKSHPLIEHFVKTNPGYTNGDTLLVLGRVKMSKMFKLGLHSIYKRTRKLVNAKH